MAGRVKALRAALTELLDEAEKNATPNVDDALWKKAIEDAKAALALPPDDVDDEVMDDYQAMQEENTKLRESTLQIAEILEGTAKAIGERVLSIKSNG